MSTGWEKEFDASVGLLFSLRAFERYRKSGLLSAELRAVPGVRGTCQAHLELLQGKVISCYVIDRQGVQHHPGKDMLIRLDEEKGPFAWIFYENEEPTQAILPHTIPAPPKTPTQTLQSPVLRPLTDHIDKNRLAQWTPQQQFYLYQIFCLVDGKHSVEDIKKRLPLAPGVVDEGLRILLQLDLIALV